MVCLEDLPNEIIYRIFDNLDIYSIVLFTYTCTRYFQCRHRYNQYRIDFQSILKSNFDLVCRVINPSHIISLKLSDDDNKTPGQIQTFLKSDIINRLTRLKCLQLLQINENHLENLLKHFQKSSITSLHIEYRQYFGMLSSSAFDLLHRILSLKTLKKLNLDMRAYETVSLQWPQTLSIEHLTLVHLSIKQFIQIFSQPNQFQSIRLRQFSMKDYDVHSVKVLYCKELKSFEIEESELLFDKIQCLLSFMSKLLHLKFEGFTSKFDKIFENNQLEEFIRTNLSDLKTFEFFIRFLPVEFKLTTCLITSLIEQFKRSFWMMKLHCSTICDFIQDTNELHFYSIPSPCHCFKYVNLSTLTSISTQSEFNYLSERFNSVYQLDLNLKDLPVISTQTKNISQDQRLFPNLRNLKLTITDHCSLSCFEYLFQTIYLEKLDELSLIISSRSYQLDLLLKQFLIFLNDLPTVTTLEIFNRWYGISSFIPLKYFCSIFPKTIRHFNVDIANMNEIPIFIEQLSYLSSLKFKFSFDKFIFIQNILDWFTKKKINSTYICDMHYLAVWISKPMQKINVHKRIKLNH
ncbi:hypothetical protein I4U23_003611 [Adineta vaga]|nr:hypothetical protein I4U23_003611 [Adineta vaga]